MPKNNNGFTLIELLVVVFIIGLIAMMTTLTVSTTRSGRVVTQEAQQLQRILQLAAQTAMIEQMELGVGLWEGGYDVWQYNMSTHQWSRVPNDVAFKEHTLPSSIVLSLQVERRGQSLPRASNAISIPQLLFSSSGTATQAVISVSTPDVTDTIEIKNDGEVVLHEPQ